MGWTWLRACETTLGGLLALLAVPPAFADMDRPFAERLTPEVAASLFPEADRIGPVAGTPPVAPVFEDGEAVGYLFSTHETVRPAGYAGDSFDIVVALDRHGTIRGHRLLEEHEPLISDGMIPPENFIRFLGGLHGTNVRTSRAFERGPVDGVSGATVSAMAMKRAMFDAAQLVGRRKGLVAGTGASLAVDRFRFAERSWAELIADGSIARLRLGNGDVRRAFADRGITEASMPLGADAATFITLYAGLATPPTVGRNLFGPRAYRSLTADGAGDHQVFVGSAGDYRWMPANPWLVPEFERVSIRQRGRTFPLRSENFNRSWHLAIADAPPLRYAGRFRIPADSGFDPLAPWSLVLRVAPDEGSGRAVTFTLPYRIPDGYVIGERAALEAAGFREPRYVAFGLFRESALSDWQRVWADKSGAIAGLLALLAAVTAVMLLQYRLAGSRRLHAAVRIGLLSVTLVWLGWMAGGQLTILAVIAYLQALLGAADWNRLLFDPLIVILSGYVALSLVLWGRGVFCGWLCPFGALQELAARAARAVGVADMRVPERLDRRLRLAKYGVLAVLLACAVYDMGAASVAAEVEPFKTAITLGFDRAWPYVLYAGALLALGLAVERGFCRWLCPLGAALAVLGRFHLFHWLRRRAECGNPCRICEASCPVGAIERRGRIDMNECFQCLDCQVDYRDDHRCPPLVTHRKARGRLAPSPAFPASGSTSICGHG